MNKGVFRAAAREMGHPSKKLIASYVFDWVIIIVFAAAGGFLSFVHPHHRPFSLLNQDISFPLVEETVTTWMLGVIAFVVPGVIITLITLICVPGGHARRTMNRSQVIRIKLWELEKGLAGLCLSVAVAFFITQGMKNMFGKLRPSFLARCQPDLNRISEAYQGGYGQDLSVRWTLVDSSICTRQDNSILQDGFRSFPSGHSSWSWSGLLYLTLFFCSKFAIGLPHLPSVFTTTQHKSRHSIDHELLPLQHNGARAGEASFESKREYPDHDTSYGHHPHHPNHHHQPFTTTTDPLSVRNAAAAPPNYLLLLALTPIAVAVWICSTRFAEFFHFGFDILGGSLIGIATAWLAFRWYHLPISRGQGWAWGARSKDRAFAIGVGTGGYVGDEGWCSARAPPGDVEMANRT